MVITERFIYFCIFFVDMAADLVQRLRTCPAKERRAAAMELAKTGTDEAVVELIRMVDGATRDYTSRTIKTLWLKLSIDYSFEDQLIGIGALGESGNRQALDYLNRLIVFEESCPLQCSNHGDMGQPIPYHSYNNAHGKLGDVLSYTVGCFCGNGFSEHPDRTRTLEMISENITKLKDSVQNAPPNP